MQTVPYNFFAAAAGLRNFRDSTAGLYATAVWSAVHSALRAIVDVFCLKIRPEVETENQVVNICPMIKMWFAVVPNLNENVILTPSVVELLQGMKTYNVSSDNATEISKVVKLQDTKIIEKEDSETEASVNQIKIEENHNRTVDVEDLKTEQINCPSLQK